MACKRGVTNCAGRIGFDQIPLHSRTFEQYSHGMRAICKCFVRRWRRPQSLAEPLLSEGVHDVFADLIPFDARARTDCGNHMFGVGPKSVDEFLQRFSNNVQSDASPSSMNCCTRFGVQANHEHRAAIGGRDDWHKQRIVGDDRICKLHRIALTLGCVDTLCSMHLLHSCRARVVRAKALCDPIRIGWISFGKPMGDFVCVQEWGDPTRE